MWEKLLAASQIQRPSAPGRAAAVLTGFPLLLGIAGWSLWEMLLPESPLDAPAVERVSLPVTSGPISPIPPVENLNAAKVALGDRLFHDVRLSGDNSISCATCHQLEQGGADGLPRSRGVRGGMAARNAPTVFNSRFNVRQTWDGRAESLEQQIDGPVNDAREMGSSWTEIIDKLSADPTYVEMFSEVYSNGIRVENISDAIATFERTLVTPNSRFDQYLKGDEDVLSDAEIEGYQLFKNYGCIACHQGVNVGGNTFARLGVIHDYFDNVPPDGGANADLGRFNVTGLQEDKYVFKVPGLRMAALTAPYLHDGSVATLEEAIALMGFYQLGVEIPEDDIARIADFIGTLPGDYNDSSR